MKIAAHPTEHGGTMFRSRLEATWAAFFDLSGLPWAYEPIDMDGWVPDFVLWLDQPVYVEVKPAPLFQDLLPEIRSATLRSSFHGFQKAKAHAESVCVLLLGIRPNDNADYFGIGNLMDPPTGKWWDLFESLQVKNATERWGAAQTLTQWQPK